MKKTLILFLALAVVAGIAVAATKTPTVYTSNISTYARSTDMWKITSFTLGTGYVTSAKNDTVEIAVSASEAEGLIGKDGSIVTLFCNFDGNDEIAADSGDVVVKVIVGADSAAWYSPAFAVSDTSENTLNDSTYSFTPWTVQPDNGGTQYLSLPFLLPAKNLWTRLKMVFSSSRMNTADTCFLYQRQLLIKRYQRP